MWWEYAIVFGGLTLAVGYVLWFLARSFSGGCGCGSTHCATKENSKETDSPAGLKVTPLVQIRPPKK